MFVLKNYYQYIPMNKIGMAVCTGIDLYMTYISREHINSTSTVNEDLETRPQLTINIVDSTTVYVTPIGEEMTFNPDS